MSEDEPRGITFQPDIYPKVLSLMPEDKDCKILDLGAGQGYFCKLLKEAGYTNIEACDYDADNFKMKDITFHESEFVNSIDIDSDTYDCVVSIEVLEHVENHFRFVSEAMRVLKPGGTIIFSTPNISSFSSRMHHFIYGYNDCAPLPIDPHREDYYMFHINPIGIAEILYLIERFGGELTDLTTNRIRRSSRLGYLFIPLMHLALRVKFLRAKYKPVHELHRKHIKWMLHPDNLLGRITIAIGRKKD